MPGGDSPLSAGHPSATLAAEYRLARRAQHAAIIAKARKRSEWANSWAAYRYQEFGDLLPLLDHERQADFMDPESPMGLWPGVKEDALDTLPSIASLLHLHAQMRRRGGG
jgi:hypothetical protein